MGMREVKTQQEWFSARFRSLSVMAILRQP